MRIQVLVDNITDYSLFKSEWGLSILFEYGKKKVLLDFGQSSKFKNNAYHLDIDLSKLDYACLSHAHYDHANGMNHFMKINKNAKVYMSREAQDLCYRDAKTLGIKYKKYIGINKGYLKKYSDRIEYIDKKKELSKGIYLMPYDRDISLNFDSSMMTKHMYVRKYDSHNGIYKKEYIPDTFNHESTLVFDTSDGLVIANSCSHMGVINIINDVKKAFPGKHIYAYVGGLHLFNASDDMIKKVGKTFLDEDIDYVITGHCTKEHAGKILSEMLKERMRFTESGYEIEI